MPITINGTTGIGGVDGSAGTPAYQGTDTNTGISFGTDVVIASTGGTERARVDSAGRLLVGTSTALGGNNCIYARVQVVGNSAVSPGGGLIAIGRNEAATSITTGESLGTLVFGDSGAGEYAWITCEADGTAGSGDYPGRLVFSTTADGAASPTERMSISQSGTLDTYGTPTDSAYTVRVSHAAGTTYGFLAGRYSANSTSTGITSFFVYTNGNVVNSNNSYGALSDIKLKENIIDASSQWDDIKALQVRKYNFKEGQTHTQIGLIAQEVELVSPGLVSESPDRDAEGNDLGTTTKSVNYSVLYMKAVKALQEAMERIEQLEARITTLEAN